MNDIIIYESKYTDNITSVIKDDIYPKISESLDKPNGISNLKKCIKIFLESRSEALYDTGPNDRIFFGKNDIDLFFKYIGIEESEIVNMLTNAYFWNISFSPIAIKDPFTDCVLMIIRYFLKKKMNIEAELAGVYLAFSGKFYPSLHYNSFPTVVPGEHRAIMDYVINVKLSQKFDIKHEGSVFNAIRSIVLTWIHTYENTKFQNPTDEDIAYLIQQLQNRIKSFIKNIAKLYYDAYKNKDYLNFESDNLNQDDFRIVENNSTKVSKYTDATIQYMCTGVNYKFCKICSDQNVKQDEVKSIMEGIIHNPKYISDLAEVISLIISDYYFYSKEKDIRSVEFLAYAIKSRPNARSKDVLKTKMIIEGWLDETSENYRKRKSRDATKNSYYKAILKYIILSINNANK